MLDNIINKLKWKLTVSFCFYFGDRDNRNRTAAKKKKKRIRNRFNDENNTFITIANNWKFDISLIAKRIWYTFGTIHCGTYVLYLD